MLKRAAQDSVTNWARSGQYFLMMNFMASPTFAFFTPIKNVHQVKHVVRMEHTGVKLPWKHFVYKAAENQIMGK